MERLPMNRSGYGSSYYEDEKEIIRGPYDTYSSEYKAQEYTNTGYPLGHRHNGELVEEVTTVRYENTPGYNHHHHGDGGEYVERKEKIIYENDYDPYRRLY